MGLDEDCDLGYIARIEAHGIRGILPAEIGWCCRDNSNLDYQDIYSYLAKSCWEEYFQVYMSANGTSYQETKVDSQMFEIGKYFELTP